MPFNKQFRNHFANRVTRHYDKYCEITNPLTFCPFEDVYRQAFTGEQWRAFLLLFESDVGGRCFSKSNTFDLYLPGCEPTGNYESRRHVSFNFPDGLARPDCDIQYEDLAEDKGDRIATWLNKALHLKILRQSLYNRVECLVDDGWERAQKISRSGGWIGAAVPGQGCNTPGQVYRIWPELLPFMDTALRATVRNSSVKSRMPSFLKRYGTIRQFQCLDNGTAPDNDDGLMTDDETKFERRKFEALTHILVQMSLMTDVPHDRDYPSMHNVY